MKLKGYLLSQLSNAFFPIFLGLFFITSIIFLVRIASFTSVVTINFFELATLYSYVIPNILFYTLPVSFFISLVITLAKLSSEYELIVITSFGLNPKNILKIFLPVSFIISISLLVISLGLIPKTKYLTNKLMDQKTKEANFNIKASEFGQKFGDWLIYISKKDDKYYEEVKLFKTEKELDQFIISKSANLNNESGDLSFVLNNGKTFYFEKDKVNQINYEKMHINDTVAQTKLDVYTNVYDYWEKRINVYNDGDKFTFYILTSIFPFISLFAVISFGYFNPRYEKNSSVALAVSFTVVYYIFSDYLSKSIIFNALYTLPIVWFLFTYYLYRRNIKKVY